MTILIDNGHGETSGNGSPDGRLKEWKYCRQIAEALHKELVAKGYEAKRIVEEDADISLYKRCARVNEVCSKVGAENVLLVSIHNDAAGTGRSWKGARGWTVYVFGEAGRRSRLLAQHLYKAAERRGLKGNRCVPDCRYWEANYYILKHTLCPAVLTENLYQDNKEDVDFLLSEEGRRAIVELHVEGIVNYIKSVS